jgi:hypothetical protein
MGGQEQTATGYFQTAPFGAPPPAPLTTELDEILDQPRPYIGTPHANR